MDHYVRRAGSGQRVLDLGCGTGKQIFAVADLVLPNGSILGFDVSQEVLDEVTRRAQQEHRKHISVLRGSLDDVVEMLASRQFDLILSTYAIYYAKDFVRLLIKLRNLLSTSGMMFVSGFGRGTNKEMVDLINRLSPKGRPIAHAVEDFISENDIGKLRGHYRRVDVARLENRAVFNSHYAVMKWWRNHSSYVPSLDATVEKEVRSACQRDGSFELTKNVLGLHFHI